MAIDRTEVTKTTKHVTGQIVLDIAPSSARIEVMLQRGNPKLEDDGVTPVLGAYGKQDYDFVPGTRYSLSVRDPETILSLMGAGSFLILKEWLTTLVAAGAVPSLPSDAEIVAALQTAAGDGYDLHHALVTPLESLADAYWSGAETTAEYRQWYG